MSRPWFETAFGASYPVVYAHRDAAEAERAVALVERLLGATPGPWLDLGCGQGRHLDRLAATGRRVVGMDLSPELLSAAREDGVGQPLLRGDMRHIPLKTASLAGVASMFTAFGYFDDFHQHRLLVQEIARVLIDGGRWVLDFLNSERVADELVSGPASRRRRAGPLMVSEERRLETAPRRVLKRVKLELADSEADDTARTLGIGPGGLTYQEQVTLFSLDQLDQLAGEAGLVRVDAAGDYDGAVLRPLESPRWILVYGKNQPADSRPPYGKDPE